MSTATTCCLPADCPQSAGPVVNPIPFIVWNRLYISPRYVTLVRCMSWPCVLSKRLNESSWFSACELNSFHAPHSVIRKFGYLQKQGYFPLSQTLRKFRNGKSIVLSTKTRGRSSLWITPTTVEMHCCWTMLMVYYKSVDCNAVTPLLRFVVD